jgi:hypothetical protein
MLWGAIPFISLPMILFMISSGTSASLILAQGFNGLTILPACALAFLNRKIASWWLIADAVVIAYVGLNHPAQSAVPGWEFVIGAAVAALLGGFGLMSEKQGWPLLMDSKKSWDGKSALPSTIEKFPENVQDHDVI